MAKHTLRILRCSNRKILKVFLAIYQHHEMKGKWLLAVDYFRKKFHHKCFKGRKYTILFSKLTTQLTFTC